MEFLRKEYWNRLPFPSLGIFPTEGLNPGLPHWGQFLYRLSLQRSPLLGIYPEDTKTEKGTHTPIFIAALFAIARTRKQPRCPLTDEWIKKL